MSPAAIRSARLVSIGCVALTVAAAPSVLRAASPAPTAAHWKPIPLLSAAASPGVFDAPHHRLILFPEDLGVTGAGDLWMLDTRDTKGWAATPVLGTPPPWRRGRVAVFDPVRDRVLVWGGTDFNGPMGSGADLWVLDLAAAPTWSHVTCEGTLPGDRMWPSAIYDPLRDRMLVFGGEAFVNGTGASVFDDVWALGLGGTPTWSPVGVPGPLPDKRCGAAAIYDPVRDRLVIQGGQDSLSFWSGYGPRSDAWALSLSGTPAWTRLFQGAGGGESYGSHAAVYDPDGDRMLLIGGVDSTWYPTTFHRELRAIGLASGGMTTVLDTTGAPDGMGLLAAVVDPALDAVIVHGEARSWNEAAGTWRLDLAGTPSWTGILPAVAEPQSRFGMAQAYDARRGRTLFFGGRWTYYVAYEYPTTYFDDLWSLRLGAQPEWTRLTGADMRPPTRQYATLVADPDADRMWMYGGDQWVGISGPGPQGPDAIAIGSLGSPVFLGDLWRLDLSPAPTWFEMSPVGTPPSKRDGHVAVLDTRRHRMLLFGGRDSLGLRNDVWSLSLGDPPVWTPVATTGIPPLPRAFSVGGYDWAADRLLVYGGVGSGGASYTDLWSLPLGTLEWTPVATTGSAPATLSDRPDFFDTTHRRLVVVGSGSDALDAPPTALSVLSFDGDTPAWATVPADGAVPPDREGRAACWDESAGRVVVLWGAAGRRDEYNESLASQIAIDEVAAGVSVPPPAPERRLALAAPIPNPVRDGFRVRGWLASGAPATLELLDLAGRRVRSARLAHTAPGPFETAFRTDGLGAGLYWLRLAQDSRSVVSRVVVLR